MLVAGGDLNSRPWGYESRRRARTSFILHINRTNAGVAVERDALMRCVRNALRYGSRQNLGKVTLAGHAQGWPDAFKLFQNSARRARRRAARARGRAPQKQSALACVARERGRALELRARLAEAPELGEEVAARAGQKVISLERR